MTAEVIKVRDMLAKLMEVRMSWKQCHGHLFTLSLENRKAHV